MCATHFICVYNKHPKIELPASVNKHQIMKEKFVEKESHKHRLAKELLASWFHQQDEMHDFCQVAQFTWRSNYGVYTELKFYETSDPYYFECSAGLKDYAEIEDKDVRGDNPLEWFDPLVDRGKILFVPDITIFHKGSATILIEVVHKNPLTNTKIDIIKKFFEGYHVEVYEIEAEEILRHTGIPNNLKCKQVL